tara:strand:- start:1517 stop:2179 length:663 start_codon:yes stop_codon:yes gene_type:complete
MHKTIQNLNNIKNSIKSKVLDLNHTSKLPKIIAVSKTFNLDNIKPLIEYGHVDFGENKVQEAVNKWNDIKSKNENIKLHLIGKLQTNKVKVAIKLFDFIHSLDNEKLAKKISDEQFIQNIKPKIFIQINIGDEQQKSGVRKTHLNEFYKYCLSLNLDIIGTMCLPPINKDSSKYFSEMLVCNNKLNLSELSMGMSSDYLQAIEYKATFLRIGSNIFGERN